MYERMERVKTICPPDCYLHGYNICLSQSLKVFNIFDLVILFCYKILKRNKEDFFPFASINTIYMKYC